MNELRPLAGRRIVITRANGQADEFARHLREQGADVMMCPMVRFLKPEDTGELDQAIASLQEFDWLIFTSANAVRFFLSRCRHLGRDGCLGTATGSPRIAAVGGTTQVLLEAERLRPSLVPSKFNGAALGAELSAEVKGRNVLLPRSDQAGGELPEALRAAGARLTEVTAYRTAPLESVNPALRAELLDGTIDAVTFFSPSAFRNFERALGETSLQEMGRRTAFAVVGPVTAAEVRKAGLSVAVEAAEASSASLAAALGQYFSMPGARKESPDNVSH